MIMPTPKRKWDWIIRRYNYKTGEHIVLEPIFDTKEKCMDKVKELRQFDILKRRPYNYVMEKVEANRPDLHHERLMEEDRYPKPKEGYRWL